MDAAAGGSWRLTALARLRLALQERLGVPGIYLHYALRKLLIARLVDGLVRDHGIEQVVVVAAGFDPLCVLLHQAHPTVRWCELDHPATQRYKAAALSALSGGGNLALLPVDLARQSIADSFRAGGLSPGLPTLVIAEGITMYLTEERVRGLFADIRACAGAGGSHLLFTHMRRRENGSIHFDSATTLATYWLALTKESFVRGIEAWRLAPFLAGLGFSLARAWDSGMLRDEFLLRRGLGERPLATGEVVALAKAAAQRPIGAVGTKGESLGLALNPAPARSSPHAEAEIRPPRPKVSDGEVASQASRRVP
jgi:methyltransferase (TIGR00027 family)